MTATLFDVDTFAVEVVAPRTSWLGSRGRLTLDRWNAGLSNGSRYLSCTLSSGDWRTPVEGTVAGAHFTALYIEVKDAHGRSEPWTYVSRRVGSGGYGKSPMSEASAGTVQKAVAQALQRAGGYDEVWTRIAAKVDAAPVYLANVVQLQRRVKQLTESAEVTQWLNDGWLTVTLTPEGHPDRRRLTVIKPNDRDSWCHSAAVLRLNGERVGWLTSEGLPVGLSTSEGL